jgi:hypothetical protein
MTTQAKSNRSDRNRKMIAGVQKHYAKGPPLLIDGSSYAAADLEKALQGSIDAADLTASTAAAFHQAVAAEKAVNTKGDGLYSALRALLITQYRSQPAVLADYGITLLTKQVPDASTVATAVAKRAATRVARHTVGKRQKQAVTGTVPVTAPAASATAAQPVVQQSQSASAPQGTTAAAAPRVP